MAVDYQKRRQEDIEALIASIKYKDEREDLQYYWKKKLNRVPLSPEDMAKAWNNAVMGSKTSGLKLSTQKLMQKRLAKKNNVIKSLIAVDPAEYTAPVTKFEQVITKYIMNMPYQKERFQFYDIWNRVQNLSGNNPSALKDLIKDKTLQFMIKHNKTLAKLITKRVCEKLIIHTVKPVVFTAEKVDSLCRGIKAAPSAVAHGVKKAADKIKLAAVGVGHGIKSAAVGVVHGVKATPHEIVGVAKGAWHEMVTDVANGQEKVKESKSWWVKYAGGFALSLAEVSLAVTGAVATSAARTVKDKWDEHKTEHKKVEAEAKHASEAAEALEDVLKDAAPTPGASL